jgi:hypothetical protein
LEQRGVDRLREHVICPIKIAKEKSNGVCGG